MTPQNASSRGASSDASIRSLYPYGGWTAGDVFTELDEQRFTEMALDLYRWQSRHNEVVQAWHQFLKHDPDAVRSLDEICFLPISCFKHHDLSCLNAEPKMIFGSSGTSGQQRSRHLVYDLDWYRQSYLRAFEYFYGSVRDWNFFFLLPGYLERSDETQSSLVNMCEGLWRASLGSDVARTDKGPFFLADLDHLHTALQTSLANTRQTMLLGVSFALLDYAELAEARGWKLEGIEHLTVVDTGGMKGRRQELTREQLQAVLVKQFGTLNMHSEYGMTELFSQAWNQAERSKSTDSGSALFNCAPWMRVLPYDPSDPLNKRAPDQRSVGLKFIDLANRDTCAFIATEDLGIVHGPGSFEVLGRIDHSEIRGCNLLLEDLD
jgi:hypothetical protein